MTRSMRVLVVLCIMTLALTGALSQLVPVEPAIAAPEKDPISRFVESLSPGGWTDDEILQLHAAILREGSSASRAAVLNEAILNPTFPGEGRPDRFFDALASYFDKNRDGRYTLSEIEAEVIEYASRYAVLLSEAVPTGPHQDLASLFRVKTWKMMQKILLLRHVLRERGLEAWTYSPMTPSMAVESWDEANTLADAADFYKRVCEASTATPVVVKFGSTQCADCLLMEYTQGIRAAAERSRSSRHVYKFWWGPNLPEANDALRKSEGVKYSPFFIVYWNGRRYPCGFAFLDDKGAGLEE